MPMLAQLGGSLRPNPALNQLNRAVRQPPPALPPAHAQRSDQIWVPDRYFSTSVGDISYVPGHWERRINNQEYYAPSLVVCAAVGEWSWWVGQANGLWTGIDWQSRIRWRLVESDSR